MKTVAMVTSGAYSVANFRGQAIRELVQRGVRVHALAPDWSDSTRAATRAFGAEPVDISLERTGLNPVHDLADIVKLARVLRRLRPDAVLTYFAKPNMYGMIAATLARVPRRVAMVEGLGIVFDTTTPPDFKRRMLQRVTKGFYKVAFLRAQKVLFLNKEDEAFFLAERLVAREKMLNIGGIGVDLDEFTAAPPVTDPVTFVMMARLLRGKGVMKFAEAAELVKAQAPDTRFVLLGGTDRNPDSLTAADIDPYVERGVLEWPGHVDDVRRYLAGGSVFVLPSWYPEGLPRSTQEAAAMAKPVITTDMVGCRDTVEDGYNGFMVPPHDTDALAAAMMRFVRDPALIVSMGANSRRMAEDRWNGARKSVLLADLILPPDGERRRWRRP